MALLSHESFERKDMAGMYRVGKRFWEDGFLRYGPADYVDEDEARRIGILPKKTKSTKDVGEVEEGEEGNEAKDSDVEASVSSESDSTSSSSPSSTRPSVNDDKPTWEQYADSLNIDTTDMRKKEIIDAVLDKEGGE